MTAILTDISIILPVYNEEDNLALLIEKLQEVLDSINKNYEIVIIDDKSRDRSLKLAKEIASKDSKIKVIAFKKNFGQTAALAAGMQHCSGDVIIPMDADLQNDPKDIPLLLEKIDEGYDVASGWRKNRKDKFLSRRLPSIIANKIISRITGVKIKDFGCTLKAYKREAMEGINLYGEMHRFIPAYASWTGASIIEVPVTHHARKHGKSNYGISRTFKVILDLITVKFLSDFYTKPSYIFGGVGVLCMIGGIFSFSGAVFVKFAYGVSLIQTPLLLATVMFILLSFQFILMGLLAEISIRTYYEGLGKPIYMIKERYNFENK